MQRVKTNVETIVERLHKIGYRFGRYPDGTTLSYYVGPITPPVAGVGEKIAQLESLAGPVPLSLSASWEVVGAVDLTGFYETLPEFSDPPVVYPIEVAIEEYRFWQEWCAYDGAAIAGSYRVPMAPDEYHKDNVSGGAPYEISLPNRAIDAELENEWHETTFVEYLRVCFKWGGFPGFERVKTALPAELQALSQQLLML